MPQGCLSPRVENAFVPIITMAGDERRRPQWRCSDETALLGLE